MVWSYPKNRKSGPRATVNERLLRLGRADETTGCRLWTGSLSADGYGVIVITVSQNKRKYRQAHRVAYETWVGPIPQGLTLDHLCRQRACIEPKHLEPVTGGENTRRGGNRAKTHCKRGHPLFGRNLAIRQGKRQCKACAVIHSTNWRKFH